MADYDVETMSDCFDDDDAGDAPSTMADATTEGHADVVSSKDLDLSLLVVKTWDSDSAWSLDSGTNMYSNFDFDGSTGRVASFWAVIRQSGRTISAVELYRLTPEYNSLLGEAEEQDAELAKFLIQRYAVEESEDSAVTSAALLEVFKEVYEVVAACSAPVHGLVYVGHGNGDGGLFQSALTQKDSRELLAHANNLLGRRVDFLDFSGNCAEASLVNLANVGPYCRYLLASELNVGGFGEEGEELTDDASKARFLGRAECVYHLLMLSGHSVFEMLCARAHFQQEEWRFCKLEEKGKKQSLSIFRTECLEEFLRGTGKKLTPEQAAAGLMAAEAKEYYNTTYKSNKYDLQKFLAALEDSDEALQQYRRLRPVYVCSLPTEPCPSLNGCFVKPATIVRWGAGVDGRSEDEFKNAYYKCISAHVDDLVKPNHYFAAEESMQWENDIALGLLHKACCGWGYEEPRFPERPSPVDVAPTCFTLDANVYNNYFCTRSEGNLHAGSIAELNGEEFKVKRVVEKSQSPDDSTWTEFPGTSLRVNLDRNHGAKEGDVMTVVPRGLMAMPQFSDELRLGIEAVDIETKRARQE